MRCRGPHPPSRLPQSSTPTVLQSVLGLVPDRDFLASPLPLDFCWQRLASPATIGVSLVPTDPDDGVFPTLLLLRVPMARLGAMAALC